MNFDGNSFFSDIFSPPPPTSTVTPPPPPVSFIDIDAFENKIISIEMVKVASFKFQIGVLELGACTYKKISVITTIFIFRGGGGERLTSVSRNIFYKLSEQEISFGGLTSSIFKKKTKLLVSCGDHFH